MHKIKYLLEHTKPGKYIVCQIVDYFTRNNKLDDRVEHFVIFYVDTIGNWKSKWYMDKKLPEIIVNVYIYNINMTSDGTTDMLNEVYKPVQIYDTIEQVILDYPEILNIINP